MSNSLCSVAKLFRRLVAVKIGFYLLISSQNVSQNVLLSVQYLLLKRQSAPPSSLIKSDHFLCSPPLKDPQKGTRWRGYTQRWVQSDKTKSMKVCVGERWVVSTSGRRWVTRGTSLRMKEWDFLAPSNKWDPCVIECGIVIYPVERTNNLELSLTNFLQIAWHSWWRLFLKNNKHYAMGLGYLWLPLLH